jgi:hypothetical protein
VVRRGLVKYLVTNAHVLTDPPSSELWQAEVFQPGHVNGVLAAGPVIGVAEECTEIQYSAGGRPPSDAPIHKLDAGLVRLHAPLEHPAEQAVPDVLNVGRPCAPVYEPRPKDEVVISSARGVHKAFIDLVGERRDVSFSPREPDERRRVSARFLDVITLKARGRGPQFDDGMSGAVVWHASTLRPVGLFFAASQDYDEGLCVPIKTVLEHFGVTLVT